MQSDDRSDAEEQRRVKFGAAYVPPSATEAQLSLGSKRRKTLEAARVKQMERGQQQPTSTAPTAAGASEPGSSVANVGQASTVGSAHAASSAFFSEAKRAEVCTPLLAATGSHARESIRVDTLHRWS